MSACAGPRRRARAVGLAAAPGRAEDLPARRAPATRGRDHEVEYARLRRLRALSRVDFRQEKSRFETRARRRSRAAEAQSPERRSGLVAASFREDIWKCDALEWEGGQARRGTRSATTPRYGRVRGFCPASLEREREQSPSGRVDRRLAGGSRPSKASVARQRVEQTATSVLRDHGSSLFARPPPPRVAVPPAPRLAPGVVRHELNLEGIYGGLDARLKENDAKLLRLLQSSHSALAASVCAQCPY